MSRHRLQRHCLWLITLALPALNGCLQQPAPEAPEQLSRWLEQIKTQPAGVDSLPPLPETPPFHALAYRNDSTTTPFGDDSAATKELAAALPQHEVRPPQRGIRQPLEDFPLESMRLVGTLARGSDRHALVQIAGQLHQLHIGDYAGTRFGVVERISETVMMLQELIPDADGTWTTRHTSLAMEGSPQ